MAQAIRRPAFRLHPLLFRRIHKWVGLILSLQFVLWTVSGAVMALLDMNKVGGHAGSTAISAASAWPAPLADFPVSGKVEGLALRRVAGQPVYEIRDASGVRLADAVTGERVIIDAALASRIARAAYHHEAPVRSVERLADANLESRDHAGPMWRVDFDDADNSTSYISATTGQALVNRTDTWRLWDFVWMLHNMDYSDRSSFNHPLIIFVAFGTLWLSFTGFYLLFKSFRSREFNWLLGRRKR